MKAKRVWISEDLYKILRQEFCKSKKRKNGIRRRKRTFVDFTQDLANGREKGIDLKMLNNLNKK